MSDGSLKLLERHLMETGGRPVDITGAGLAGDYFSMKNTKRLFVAFLCGAWAGGTSAVTLKQASDVAGTGEKALAFTKVFKKVSGAGASVFVEEAVVANTFLLDTAGELAVVEVKASDLDVDGGFDCIRADAATPGANADLLAIFYFGDSREMGAPATLPDPKID